MLCTEASPMNIEAEISASLVDLFIFQLQLKEARKACFDSARTREKSRMLRAQANRDT